MRRCRVLYVSPLKALAVDVERNLRSPLAGIRPGRRAARAARARTSPSRCAPATPRPTSGALFARRPADILITTPESLFLLLTSAARESLRGVDTVIIDEVHAVCATKRGAHLALSPRTARRAARPARRSASGCRPPCARSTRSPPSWPAAGRSRSCSRRSSKTFDLQVVVPVEDMSALGEPTDDLTGAAAGAAAPRLDLAARRGARARPGRGPPLDDRVRQLAPAGRAADRAAERARHRASRRSRRRAGDAHAGPAHRRSPDPGVRPATSSSPAPTTARCRASSARSSRRTSRPAGCRRWSRPRRSSSASTWARSTSSCRSSRRPRWRPGCSGSAGPGTRSAPCRAA